MQEYVKLAVRNIRGNLLRTILTCFIIALGIAALVGIQTAISSLGNQLGEMFSPFGTNQFTISNRASNFSSNEERKINPVITYEEAQMFKKNYRYPSKVSIDYRFGGNIEIKGNNETTNPNFSIIGVDNYYMELNNQEVETGREFSTNELNNGVNVILITTGLKNILFKGFKSEEVINQRITVSGRRYTIVGILKDQGQGFGGNSNQVYIPLQNINLNFARPTSNYSLKIGVNTTEMVVPGIEEAKGIMRLSRGLRVIDDDNFDINNPNAADKQLKAVTKNVSLAGFGIAIVTLSGAAIGLMNILLVSVTERIREIGISKAIGATARSISLLYFLEGIIISLLGGILGVVLGLLVGLGVATATKATFVVPWLWIFIGITICLIVGLVSSIYPAIKASKLNPIDALRQN